jgi:hypothetical protein
VGGQVVSQRAQRGQRVRTAAGRYRVHFAVAMPDATTAGRRSPAAAPTPAAALASCAPAPTKTAQYVDISCATTASFDDEINLVVYR